ncbi:hypothetical protein [Mycobacterium sp.]|uniref:hypothetical protein n=1 Tax=Mycobacterium sp. TaxID=1785 RepID=UPI002BA4494F|nr:hypothetical protein [Mycobacterium sp.]HTQ17181.1 hypothetical protein [Mycobacterium sp.]
MPAGVSNSPAAPYSSSAPRISAHKNLVTGSGFLPDHLVALRITRAGDDIDDYLTYVTNDDGCLHCELPASLTGTLHIAATDHRPHRDGACGRLWSNTCTLVVTGP